MLCEFDVARLFHLGADKCYCGIWYFTVAQISFTVYLLVLVFTVVQRNYCGIKYLTAAL